MHPWERVFEIQGMVVFCFDSGLHTATRHPTRLLLLRPKWWKTSKEGVQVDLRSPVCTQPASA